MQCDPYTYIWFLAAAMLQILLVLPYLTRPLAAFTCRQANCQDGGLSVQASSHNTLRDNILTHAVALSCAGRVRSGLKKSWTSFVEMLKSRPCTTAQSRWVHHNRRLSEVRRCCLMHGQTNRATAFQFRMCIEYEEDSICITEHISA